MLIVSDAGKTRLKKQIALYGNGKDRYKNHSNDEIFKRNIFGLEVEQHICMKTKHAVILIEGLLFDSSSISEHEGITSKEVSEYGFRQLIDRGGMNNFFIFHPYLKNYIIEVKDRKDVLPLDNYINHFSKELQGFEIIDFNI